MLIRSTATKSRYRSSRISMSLPPFLKVCKNPLGKVPRTLFPINLRVEPRSFFLRGESKRDRIVERENERMIDGKRSLEAFPRRPHCRRAYKNNTRRSMQVNR